MRIKALMVLDIRLAIEAVPLVATRVRASNIMGTSDIRLVVLPDVLYAIFQVRERFSTKLAFAF
jgi:hypothetical protein